MGGCCLHVFHMKNVHRQVANHSSFDRLIAFVGREPKKNSRCILFSRAMLMNGPFFALFTALAIGAGMVAFAYYTQRGCDPAKAGYISNNNQVRHISWVPEDNDAHCPRTDT